MENTDNKENKSPVKGASAAKATKPAKQPAEPKERKGGAFVHVIYLFLLLAAAGGAAYVFIEWEDEKKLSAELRSELDDESRVKEEKIAELDALKAEYESLKSDNDSVNAIVDAKIEEIEKLKKKVYFYSRQSYDVSKYKKEIKQLTAALKHTYKMIDSLGVANKYLADSTASLNEALDEQLRIDMEKTQEMEVMAEKIDKGSALKVQNLIAEPINKKGKLSLKAKKVTGVKIMGTIAENFVVDPGTKKVYARIVGPGDAVLTSSSDNVFEFSGEELIYSTEKEISYSNSEAKLSMNFKVPSAPKGGKYSVKLFAEGRQIGETKFVLK